MQLDLGGVAKGYAVDRLGQLLRRRGVTAAVAQVGGEVLAFGESDVGPWRLGVQHPTKRGQIYGVVEHRGTVRVSTSGNYEQPVRIGGRTYYHILVPSTGRPASTRVRGVTVASFDGGPDNATLDAAATAAVVVGAKRATALIRALGGEALVIEGAPGGLRESVTPGFAARWRRRARSSD
jgi:thiamine biosynthesis lipoprotein